MSRSDSRYNLIVWLAASVLAATLSACGGDGGTTAAGSSNAVAGNSSGRVAVLFTDGPTAAFQQINVTVTAVQLLGPDGPQSLYSGEKSFDLLALSSHAEMFSLADVAPGSYDKIRLTVKDIELVRQDSSGAVIDRIHPKLPGNGKLDLVPRASINVAAGQALYLQLDMDAAKSIHIVATGNGQYIFRPVILVDVLGADTPGKVVRLHGDVQSVDLAAQRLSVCISQPASRTLKGQRDGGDDQHFDDSSIPQNISSDTGAAAPQCVTVQVDDATSLFDAQGDPAQLSDLTVGDPVTALGRFAPSTDNSQELEFHAAVIEVGPTGAYTQLQGDVQSVATDHSSFMLSVAPGQGFAAGTVLQVMVQDGTRLFTRQGTALAAADIGVGDAVKVEGVVVLSDTEPDRIKAAIIFVAVDAADGPVTGTLGPIDVATNTFTLITTGGDRCVTLANGAHLFRITDTSTGFVSEAIALSDLTSGQRVDVYGPLGVGGCYLVHDVLAAAP